jgi:hypothetical protein
MLTSAKPLTATMIADYFLDGAILFRTFSKTITGAVQLCWRSTKTLCATSVCAGGEIQPANVSIRLRDQKTLDFPLFDCCHSGARFALEARLPTAQVQPTLETPKHESFHR